MFTDRPVIGHGYLKVKNDYIIPYDASPTGEVPIHDVHNTYVQIFMDLGLIGVIPFFLFMFFLAREVKTSPMYWKGLFFIPCFFAMAVMSFVHGQLITGDITSGQVGLVIASSQAWLLNRKMKADTV